MLEEPSILEGCRAAPSDMETDDVCWICLDDTKDRDPLFSPCSCPRRVHPRCLARWQLQQAGRLEETNCRFCHCDLADWKVSLTPDNLKPDVQRVQPIMVVYFEGQIHRIPVKQGPDGLTEFTLRIRELFRLPEDVDISLTFGCKEPLSGQHLKLEGIGAFDAAVHCASVAAAERQHKLKSEGGAPGEGGDGATAAGGPTMTLGPNGETIGSSEDGGEEEEDSGTAAPPPYPSLAHHQQHHLHDPFHDAAMSVSAPASAHTSGGGAPGGDGAGVDAMPLLHPAASAPVLSQLLAAAHQHPHSELQQHHQHHHQHGARQLPLPRTPPPAQQQQQQGCAFPACSSSSLSDAASAHTSARTSSGGGGIGGGVGGHGGAATPPRRPAMGSAQQLLQFQADQRPLDGSPPPPLTAAAYPPLPGLFTPFQSTAAAPVGSRYSDVLSRAPAAGLVEEAHAPQEAQMQAQVQQQPMQVEHQPMQQAASALRSHGASMTAVGQAESASTPLPLANALSEPFAAAATAAAARLSPDAPQTPAGAQPTLYPHAYGAPLYPPYSAMYGGASSPYGAPPLPPLPPTHFLRPASPPSSSPTPPAATPPTPRDLYDSPVPDSRYTHQHPNHPNHLYPNYQPLHQAHSQQHLLLPSYPSADPPGGGGGTPGALGPATPNAACPSPRFASSPTASSPTANGWYGGRASPSCAAVDTPLARFTASGCGPLQAGMMLAAATAAAGSPTGGGAAADGGGVHSTANRRARRASSTSPCSELDMAVCVASPSDEPGAAVGSLTGRLKFSLKAFSRKVARSLSFQRGAVPTTLGGGGGAAAAPCAGGGLLLSVAEAEGAWPGAGAGLGVEADAR
ncbi:hypothetical protein TSOC_008028 [Tetrabaena socialis]|uniref:RING-CH-type domain-containing protein n=1 Tax=Tetrabaena socialis TaxID=47790 RepID=A0A2J7ZZL2_9CHLO|nr:hypothetical protein TSOC_008028 [Tetrabaena socialis]|eukprot:PNH05678.1 hypothetical protein TSOC_008028 [Tetrabaena socialis]